MAIAYVAEQGKKAESSTASTMTVTLTGTTTVGNTMILLLGGRNSSTTITSVTDTRSNTWTVDKLQTFAGDNDFDAICSCLLTTALQIGDVVTVNFGVAPGASREAFLEEFSGLATSSYVDQTGGASSGSGSAVSVSSSGATTQSDELVIVAATQQIATTTWTVGTNYTQFTTLGQATSGASNGDRSTFGEYRIISSSGTQTATATTPSNTGWCAAMVTYKASVPAIAPSNTTPPALSGQFFVGNTVTSGNGNWANGPTSYSYQWQRSANGTTGWANIGSAALATYTLAAADDSQYLRCQVTATNSFGSSPATSSNVSGLITYTKPTNLYGEVWNSDGLANLEVGKVTGRKISIRFRASHSDTLVSVVWYQKTGVGYSLGTGGSVRIQLQTDDGSGFPSGTVVASHTQATPNASAFPVFIFDTPGAVTAGNIYHLVFENTDVDPVSNYISMDDLELDAGTSPMQPSVPDSEMAIVWKYDTGSSWVVNLNHGPIFAATYDDGTVDGQGYYDAFSSSGLKNIDGTNYVHQIFTPTTNVDVTNISVRLFKNASSSQPLVVKIKDGSDATLATASIPASSIATTMGWVSATVSSLTLTPGGAPYKIELSAPSETFPYQTFPISADVSNGLYAPNRFMDGYFESSSNSGGSWALFSGTTKNKLQAYVSKPPAASGTVQIGRTLSATSGSWTSSPSYTYQWQDSNNGTSGWTNVSGATSSTYLVGVTENNKYLRCQVTATNDGGSTTAVSNTIGQVVTNEYLGILPI